MTNIIEKLGSGKEIKYLSNEKNKKLFKTKKVVKI